MMHILIKHTYQAIRAKQMRTLACHPVTTESPT